MKRYFYTVILMLAAVLPLQAQNFPEDGATYRIINTVRDNAVLMENYFTNELNGGAENSLCNDLWRFIKSGEGWNLQKVLTERYVQIESSNSKLYRTGETPAVFYVVKNSSFTSECYNIVNEKGGRWGIHCETDNDVVPWYSSTEKWDGSEWKYKRVDVSDEQLAEARKKVEDLCNLYNNQERLSEIYLSHFTDETCTVLKSEYQAMSDEELAASMDSCGDELTSIAIKIKNDTWAEREKEFRVCTYGPYSNPDIWGEIVKNKYYSWLNNPTGICATSGDVLYVFVGKEPKAGSTLEIDAIVGNSYKGKRTELKKGMNVIPVTGKDISYFIIYTADTRKDDVYLADFDSIPIHIEGGYVNGYWDKQRHNDADWVDLTRNHAKHKYMFVRGDYMMYFMNRQVMISNDVCPKTITDAIGWWDDMARWQMELIGIEEYYPSRYNNKHCAVSFDGDGLMSATNHQTNYVEGCLHDVLPFEDILEESGHCWGPSHEVGHVHQNLINMIACAEASNNLFSNISVFNIGKFVTWGDGIDMMADYYEDNVPWTSQGIGIKMRMYFQLYLYYHVCGHDTQFYPKLFKLLRANPMKKTSGGALNYGKYDLLHFAERCSEAAGEDLTNFFEAWGFFKPMAKVEASDYGDYVVTSTQSMINNTKAFMAKYPKAAAIEFIEDRAAPSLRTDGGEGYKQEYVDGKFGELGQYTAFMSDSIDAVANNYIYTRTGNKITISDGTGAVGFKVYDSDSTLLTFSNFYTFTLSEKIADKDIIIVAVSANGTEVVVNDKKNGSEAQQLEALKDVIAEAEFLLTCTDNTNKNVGYFYKCVIDEFTPFVEEMKAIAENKDQSQHTYGEWADILTEKIKAICADNSNRVQLHAGNSYQLFNVNYPTHSMYYSTDGLTCKSGTSGSKYRSFTFVAGENENEYCISSNGNYISYIGRSSQAKAASTKKADALRFTVGEFGIAKYYIYKTGDTDLGIHCDQKYKVVGWNHTEDPSLWTLQCVNQKKEKADEKSLNALISEAVSIHDFIVDSTKTDATIVYDWVIVSSETLTADIDAMMAKVAVSQNVIENKYYEKCPALIDELTALIATVKSGYSVITGINGVVIDEQNAVIYDSRGRRVNKITSSGIYIVNGKKMYIE